MAESVSKEVLKRLGIHLKAQVSELQEVLEDFPESNVQLKYPALSIFTGAPDHRPFAPYLLSKTDPDVNNQSIIKYVVGDYEFRLQLDLWCRSKVERHKLYEKVYLAFTTQFPVMGLSLNLTDYHNTICRYDLVSYDFEEDNEAGSQRKEWRAKMGLVAHCKAIKEVTQYVMQTFEVDDQNITENQAIPE